MGIMIARLPHINNDYDLGITCAYAMFFGHLIIAVTFLILCYLGGYSIDSVLESLELIAPLFAAYTTLAGRSFFKEKPAKSKAILRHAVIFTLMIVLLLIVGILLAVIAKAFNLVITSMSDLRKVICAIETGLGATLGFFLSKLGASASE